MQVKRHFILFFLALVWMTPDNLNAEDMEAGFYGVVAGGNSLNFKMPYNITDEQIKKPHQLLSHWVPGLVVSF